MSNYKEEDQVIVRIEGECFYAKIIGVPGSTAPNAQYYDWVVLYHKPDSTKALVTFIEEKQIVIKFTLPKDTEFVSYKQSNKTIYLQSLVGYVKSRITVLGNVFNKSKEQKLPQEFTYYSPSSSNEAYREFSVCIFNIEDYC